MKINTKALSLALQVCASAIPSSKTLPILSSVKLCINDGLEITATSLDVWVVQKVPCEGEITSCCVNHGALKSVVDNAVSETITLSISSGKLVIESGSSIVKLPTLPAKEFPAEVFEAKPLAVVPNDLADAIESVCWAADLEGNKPPIYSNMLIRLEPKALKAVASRSVVSAIFNRPLICEEKDIVAPAKHAGLIVPALREKDSEVLLSDKFLIAKNPSGLTAVLLSNIGYLKWESIQNLIDLRGDSEGVVIDSETLKRACLGASIVCLPPPKDDYALEVEQENGTLRFSSGEDYHESIESKGEPSKARFNSQHLTKALHKLKSDKVRMVAKPSGTFWIAGDLTVAIGQMPKQGSVA